jgi:universal stress protein A
MTTQTLPAPSKSEMLVFKKILVTSDFSPASDNAFKYALQFAQHFGAQLHVIHVLEPVWSPQFAGLPEAPAFSEEELATAKKNLRAWADSAGAAGVAAKLVLRNGFPAHEIVEAAKDLDIDLVIIATQGHTGWKHFCIGSTAERVVRAAPCPVFVVREKEHESSVNRNSHADRRKSQLPQRL